MTSAHSLCYGFHYSVSFPDAVKVHLKKKHKSEGIKRELVIIVFYVSFALLDFLGLYHERKLH